MKYQYKIKLSIDTVGLRCPMPLIKAKQALRKIEAGEYIEVLTSDPSAKADFDAMLAHLPHELVSYVKSYNEKHIDQFIIQKRALEEQTKDVE